MPLLATFLASVFASIFEFMAKRLTVNVALIAAFLTTSAAAYVLVKSVVFGTAWIGSLVLPSGLTTAFGMLLPSNFNSLVTSIWVGDTAISSWGFWQQRIPVLYQLGKA
jgi:hypothetical protein